MEKMLHFPLAKFKVPELKKLRSISARPSWISNCSIYCLCTLSSKTLHEHAGGLTCFLTLAIAGALILWLLNTISHLMIIFLQCTTKVCSWKLCATRGLIVLEIVFQITEVHSYVYLAL